MEDSWMCGADHVFMLKHRIKVWTTESVSWLQHFCCSYSMQVLPPKSASIPVRYVQGTTATNHACCHSHSFNKPQCNECFMFKRWQTRTFFFFARNVACGRKLFLLSGLRSSARCNCQLSFKLSMSTPATSHVSLPYSTAHVGFTKSAYMHESWCVCFLIFVKTYTYIEKLFEVP